MTNRAHCRCGNCHAVLGSIDLPYACPYCNDPVKDPGRQVRRIVFRFWLIVAAMAGTVGGFFWRGSL